MLGRLYHIVVAVVAVSLVVAIVGGALFAVIFGLLSEFLDIDIWTPVSKILEPLLKDLEALARALWNWAGEMWDRGADLLNGAAPGPGETPPPDGGGGN